MQLVLSLQKHVTWAASLFPSTPLTSCGVARAVEQFWYSCPLKGPTEVHLLLERPREIRNRKVRTHEKRRLSVYLNYLYQYLCCGLLYNLKLSRRLNAIKLCLALISMDLETPVCSPWNHRLRLVAGECFILIACLVYWLHTFRRKLKKSFTGLI